MFRSKMTIGERIEDLSVIEDIDEMLIEGSSCGDVARFIHDGLEELTDVKLGSLQGALDERRKKLRKSLVPVEEQPAVCYPPSGGNTRRIGRLASNQYQRVRKGIDRMIELECSYLAARDRLDMILDKEQDAGFPFEMTGREFVVLGKLLELHGKEHDRVRAAMGDGPAHEKLDLKGYSEETAQVLSNPASRRRVVSIVERLKLVRGGRDIPMSDEEAESEAQASGE